MAKSNLIYHLEPDYFQDFQCVGASCRYNCCNHYWNITIDKNTYKMLNDITEPPELAATIKQSIARTPKDQVKGSHSYAYVQLNQAVKLAPKINDGSPSFDIYNTAVCPFSDDIGLCNIQKHLGSEYLSTTCATYPRHTTLTTIGDFQMLTRSLYPSCEVVLAQMLAHPEPITFNQIEEAGTKNQLQKRYQEISDIDLPPNDALCQSHYSLMMAGIAILQYRELSLEDRLLVYGWYCSQLQDIKERRHPTYAPELVSIFIDDFMNKLQSGVFQALCDIQARDYQQYSFSYHLAKMRIDETLINHDFFSQIVNNLKAPEDLPESDASSFYGKQYQDIVGNFHHAFEGREHLLEHIIVAEAFRLQLPLSFTGDIWQNFQRFVGIYINLRFMISAYLGQAKQPDDQELLDILAYSCKLYLHNSMTYIKKIQQFMDDNECIDFPHIALMIKSKFN